jgi:hypothetical protein
MSTTYLFDRIDDVKQKLKNFFFHRKKIRALENYSSCNDFHHKNYLTLIKRCMADGFLSEKEADFLSYMLQKYEVNFLDWSHRTKWLKSKMRDLASHYESKQPVQMTIFDFDKLNQKIRVPDSFNPLALPQQSRVGKRVG